ncbi:M48 family metalloprotease [Nocardia brasiliensis]|uniref:M48 family metalloprotease n=1 Tax=Nocardia brasiliensis TaxID=37326 RepID=A0A6G9XLL2_NOCBR|nr:M48 family metalloprotease [Nocardia brasiliensis]QIS01797.1 M48 family metalloprotease [Nocardia brasiliensis]
MPTPSEDDTARRRVVRRPGFVAVAGTVALALPTLLLSALVVFALGAWIGTWLLVTVVVLWVLFGALLVDIAWLTPNRANYAKAVGFRRPIEPEDSILAAAWANVTSAPGMDGWPYGLWVQQSAEPSAYAAPSRIIAVTSSAIAGLEPRELEAVLAHELGHHVRVDARLRLLEAWIALPGRYLWALCKRVGRIVGFLGVYALVARFVVAVALLPVVVLVLTPVLGAALAYLFVILLVLEPPARAAQSRRGEYAADRVAVELGYGRELATALDRWRSPRPHPLVALNQRVFGTHPPLSRRIAAITAQLDERPGRAAF